MAISLYDASVGCYLQTLGAVENFLGKGAAHCKEKGLDSNEIVETRLFADMLPFRFQILSVAHHSLGAIRGAQAGVFSPPSQSPPHDYAALQNIVKETRESLRETVEWLKIQTGA